MLHTTLFWRYTIAHDQIKNKATELIDLQRNTVQFSPPLYIDTYIHYIQNITLSRRGWCFAGRSRLSISSKLLLFMRIMSFPLESHWLVFPQQNFFLFFFFFWSPTDLLLMSDTRRASTSYRITSVSITASEQSVFQRNWRA